MSETDSKNKPAEEGALAETMEISKDDKQMKSEMKEDGDSHSNAMNNVQPTGGEAIAEKDQNGSTEERKVISKTLSPEMALKIMKQIEYYFGNYNLPRDKFLTEEVKKDDGWVSLTTLCTFNRLAAITTDHDLITQALKDSSLIEVHATEPKIRRLPSQPLPDPGDDLNAETAKRTIYLKGCKKDGSVTLDMLLEFFKQFGPYEAIKMRRFKNKQANAPPNNPTCFKGSILVIYPNVEGAKKLMEQEEIIFHNGPLLRKWYPDYLEEKGKEIAERKAEKAKRQAKALDKESAEAVVEEKDPEPTGTYLHVSGLPNTCSREDVKAALAKCEIDTAFVGISRGDVEGYIRLVEPFSNMEAVATLKGKVEVGGTEATIRAVVGTEEIEQVKLARRALSSAITGCNKRKREGFGRSRGAKGRHSKRRRAN